MQDGTLTLEGVRQRRGQLMDELHAMVEQAPMVDRPSYQSARQALSTSVDTGLTDEEIDLFLPPSLRRGAQVPATQ